MRIRKGGYRAVESNGKFMDRALVSVRTGQSRRKRMDEEFWAAEVAKSCRSLLSCEKSVGVGETIFS